MPDGCGMPSSDTKSTQKNAAPHTATSTTRPVEAARPGNTAVAAISTAIEPA